MKAPWPIVQLGQAIRHRKEFITIDDLTEYKRCRVQLHAKGIVLRDIVTGAAIGTKKQQVCRAGEFLVAEIDAKVGGFGIVPGDLDGAIVSSHYFLYEINQQQLERRFLDYYIRTRSFRDQVEAQGSTNYAAIRPWYVLDYTIALPPLAEQQRIVARIDALAARIEEAQGLRAQAVAEVEALKGAAAVREFDQILAEFGSVPLGRVISFRYDLIRPIDGVTGPLRFIGLQHIESHTGKRIGEDNVKAEDLTGRKFIFSPGEIVYGYLRPYLNKVWIADREGVCSVDQYVIRPNSKLIDTEYLAQFMLSPRFLERANDLTHNLMLPRLRTKLLESIQIPVPPVELQHRVVAYLNDRQVRVDVVKRLQAETQAELDALLPAVLDRAFRGEL